MSLHHTSILIARDNLRCLYVQMFERNVVADALGQWESDEQRRESEAEADRVLSAYRVLGGSVSRLSVARDTIRRRYADV